MPTRAQRRGSRRRPKSPLAKFFKSIGIDPRRLGQSLRGPYGLALAGCMALGLATILGPHIDLDPFKNDPCSTGRISQVFAGVNDTTDTLTPFQQASVDDVWHEGLPSLISSGSEVLLYALNGHPSAPIRREFKGCSPRRGADDNPIFSTRAKTEERWKSDFGHRYGEAITRLPSINYDQTPLIEGIAATYEQAMQVSPHVEEVTIIVVSDGLQNISGGPSAYVFSGPRNLLDPGTTAELKFAARPMPKATIYFYLVPRTDHTNRQGQQMFARQQAVAAWLQDYYQHLGAEFVLRIL